MNTLTGRLSLLADAAKVLGPGLKPLTADEIAELRAEHEEGDQA